MRGTGNDGFDREAAPQLCRAACKCAIKTIAASQLSFREIRHRVADLARVLPVDESG